MRLGTADTTLNHRLDLLLRWKHTKEQSNKKTGYNKKQSSLRRFDFWGGKGARGVPLSDFLTAVCF